MPVVADNFIALRQKLEAARISFEANRIGEAAQAYRAIIDEIPDQPDALYMLGAIAYRMNKAELALQLYEEALKAAPNFALAWSNRAVILRVLGRSEEALQSARQAITCDPNLADGWDIAGLLLRENRHYAAALQHHMRAQTLNPRNQHIQNNYAVALAAMGQLATAHQAAQAALALDPSFAIAQLTTANVLNEAGWPERAAVHYRKAVTLDPRLTKAIASEGRSLMLMGDMEAGWAKMETRDHDEERFAALPRWQGEKVRHLLLYAEQGMGDVVHFLRYVSLIRDRAEIISFEVPSSMRRLVSAHMPGSTVIVPGDSLPPADAYGLLMSLPFFCKTTLDTIPASVPYMRAEEIWIAPWRERLGSLPRPRIGVVWMGNPLYGNDHNRSIDLDHIEPLLGLGRERFVSLQKGSTTATAANACVFDADPWLQDFADTAGLIAELDLVISVDTGVAHLAGAMGKPVWTLLPFTPDWRWMLGREDSPWYPTMRLFRQQSPGDWATVIAHVTQELRKFIAGDRLALTPPSWDGNVLRRNPHAVPLPETSIP